MERTRPRQATHIPLIVAYPNKEGGYMPNQAKILILTSRTGGGHISLAEALNDQLASTYRIEILDPQPRFVHFHYRLVSCYALWLWEAEFRLYDSPRRAALAHAIFTPVVAKRLAGALERIRPDLIITTYPFLSSEVGYVLKRMGMHIPLLMLFADPNGVHATWLTERRSIVLAPTRETYAQALSVGFDPACTHLVGWPVRAQFQQAALDQQRATILTQAGLQPERFTIFLQGGGEGAARFGRIIERVLGLTPQLQIILATGTNQALLNRYKHVPHLYPLPFTKTIAPFMAASDVIIGKAGPNVLFETVMLGKPFIATAYIPGQEMANLEFIRRHRLGWIAIDEQKQYSLLRELITTPNKLRKISQSVADYRCWNREANQSIPAIIQRLL
jgi:UDP-N-acetylglucosamine:LPS N-acetylglucosamine transferase